MTAREMFQRGMAKRNADVPADRRIGMCCTDPNCAQ